MYDDESLGITPEEIMDDGKILGAPVAHINGPTKANLDRVLEIIDAYRTGKVAALAIATGSEDGAMDAMFCDVSPNCHATRSIFACLHVIASHVQKSLG